jgi:hypothetical protein
MVEEHRGKSVQPVFSHLLSCSVQHATPLSYVSWRLGICVIANDLHFPRYAVSSNLAVCVESPGGIAHVDISLRGDIPTLLFMLLERWQNTWRRPTFARTDFILSPFSIQVNEA